MQSWTLSSSCVGLFRPLVLLEDKRPWLHDDRSYSAERIMFSSTCRKSKVQEWHLTLLASQRLRGVDHRRTRHGLTIEELPLWSRFVSVFGLTEADGHVTCRLCTVRGELGCFGLEAQGAWCCAVVTEVPGHFACGVCCTAQPHRSQEIDRPRVGRCSG